MFTALFFTSLMVSSNMAPAAADADDLQGDFETAVSCMQIDGRDVWKGEIAYYIQSYIYEGEAGADAVLPEDNTPETIKQFEEACASANRENESAAAPGANE